MAIVYIATNRLNGKRYIGITDKSLVERMARHFSQSKGNRKARFAAAIRKYGARVFDWCEICRTDTFDQAKIKEIELIALLRPEYNATSGGDGTPGTKAWNRYPVICLNDGRVFESGAAAEKECGLYMGSVSVSCNRLSIIRGLHFIRYASAMTEIERKQVISERMRIRAGRRRQTDTLPEGRQPNRTMDKNGRSVMGPMANARRVICLDDGEVYESASSAGIAYAISKSGIIELCLGKGGRKTIGGRRFKYLGESQCLR